MNIDGRTIHSQFRLGSSGICKFNPAKYKKSPDLTDLIYRLDMLIIDEISMVRVDVMEVIMHILKHFGPNPLHYTGGIQLVLVGDLLQLPPILGEPNDNDHISDERRREKIEEIRRLEQEHKTPYFISASNLPLRRMITCHLKQTCRFDTTDSESYRFLKNLNIIRKGGDIQEAQRILPSPDQELQLFSQPPTSEIQNACNYFNRRFDKLAPRRDITICALRNVAEKINDKRLREIEGEDFVSFAQAWGDPQDGPKDLEAYCYTHYLSPYKLKIRPGAQVMITKNLTYCDKYIPNGTMCKIASIQEPPRTDLAEDNLPLEKNTLTRLTPQTNCQNKIIELTLLSVYPGETIKIGKEEWRETQGVWDSSLKEWREIPIFIYIQYPVMLSWAITIHKSQGLTLENFTIEPSASKRYPTNHLIYVALSRARKLSDIHLKRKITPENIHVDQQIKKYYESLL